MNVIRRHTVQNGWSAAHDDVQPAIDRIKNSSVEEVIVTNTLPVPDDALRLDKIKVLSIASILAEAVHAIFTESSVSEIFLGDNT